MPPARVTSTSRSAARQGESHYALQVNAFDRASSILTALLAITALVVAGLVVVFFTSRVVTVTAAIPVEAVSPLPRADDPVRGAGNEGTPGLDNAPEQIEPELSDKLNLMEGLISSQTALFDDEATNPSQPTRGDGLGDSRSTNTDGTGRYGEEPQRQLRFEPDTLLEYARWMDGAGIELGVLGTDDQVYYATNLAQDRPTIRTGDPATEGRLYFNTRDTPLEPLDLRLARKAGISDKGTIILLFCGPETAQRLLALEKEKAGDRPLNQVSVTVFRVERAAGGFNLRVEEQRYKS
ncbi:hypothetical protein [Botrimarina hoheduenensis]|uniref:Uncharacterized protein n=1 Tax=Botrimarina hoheduenensis TaxID=2528000 RepID=A0A5C5VX21_9BACT|nr:hypothetical protein [Botrimarina hoheduenensis]TWT42565.1 hypothetical protein Pla111_28710 [Botrimarina hoheduenensis]